MRIQLHVPADIPQTAPKPTENEAKGSPEPAWTLPPLRTEPLPPCSPAIALTLYRRRHNGVNYTPCPRYVRIQGDMYVQI